MAKTKVKTRGLTDLNVTNAKIAAGTIDVTAKITGVVPAANLGSGTASSSTYLAGDSTYKTISEYDDNKLQSNIALLGFKCAVNGSLAKYNLQDQIIDEYEDATGIDAGNSTNENLETGAYFGGTSSAGETLSATGGAGGGASSGGAGGTGTGGTSQGTGGAGGAGSTSGTAGSAGSSGGAGGGGGGAGVAAGGAGGNGDASYYTGGGGGGASDGNGSTVAGGAGGSGYKSGGAGGNVPSSAIAGSGVDGVGSTYGGGDAGTAGSGARKNNGGGGGYAGGGGGGAGDIEQTGGSGPDFESRSGDGGSGGVVITYTNAGAQVVPKFAGTSYTVPSGSTDLIVYVIGGGGGGGHQTAGGVGGGGGGGMAQSNTFADAVRTVTYTIGASGQAAETNAAGTGTTGGTTSATIGTFITYSDLTLQSTDTTASTANPDYADMVVLMENASGTATLNTDIKGYVSEDSGVTFTQGTFVDEGSWGTNKKIIAFHDLDISAQSGSSMCYKITTHNQAADKITKIHATSIGWR